MIETIVVAGIVLGAAVIALRALRGAAGASGGLRRDLRLRRRGLRHQAIARGVRLALSPQPLRIRPLLEHGRARDGEARHQQLRLAVAHLEQPDYLLPAPQKHVAAAAMLFIHPQNFGIKFDGSSEIANRVIVEHLEVEVLSSMHRIA